MGILDRLFRRAAGAPAEAGGGLLSIEPASIAEAEHGEADRAETESANESASEQKPNDARAFAPPVFAPPAWSVLPAIGTVTSRAIHRTFDSGIEHSLRSLAPPDKLFLGSAMEHTVNPEGSGVVHGLLTPRGEVSPAAAAFGSGLDAVLRRKAIDSAGELAAVDIQHRRWPAIASAPHVASRSTAVVRSAEPVADPQPLNRSVESQSLEHSAVHQPLIESAVDPAIEAPASTQGNAATHDSDVGVPLPSRALQTVAEPVVPRAIARVSDPELMQRVAVGLDGQPNVFRSASRSDAPGLSVTTETNSVPAHRPPLAALSQEVRVPAPPASALGQDTSQVIRRRAITEVTTSKLATPDPLATTIPPAAGSTEAQSRSRRAGDETTNAPLPIRRRIGLGDPLQQRPTNATSVSRGFDEDRKSSNDWAELQAAIASSTEQPSISEGGSDDGSGATGVPTIGAHTVSATASVGLPLLRTLDRDMQRVESESSAHLQPRGAGELGDHPRFDIPDEPASDGSHEHNRTNRDGMNRDRTNRDRTNRPTLGGQPLEPSLAGSDSSESLVVSTAGGSGQAVVPVQRIADSRFSEPGGGSEGSRSRARAATSNANSSDNGSSPHSGGAQVQLTGNDALRDPGNGLGSRSTPNPRASGNGGSVITRQTLDRANQATSREPVSSAQLGAGSGFGGQLVSRTPDAVRAASSSANDLSRTEREVVSRLSTWSESSPLRSLAPLGATTSHPLSPLSQLSVVRSAASLEQRSTPAVDGDTNMLRRQNDTTNEVEASGRVEHTSMRRHDTNDPDHVIARDVDGNSEPISPESATPESATPDSASSSASTSVAPAQAASGASSAQSESDLDALAGRLYDRLRFRLKRELLDDRERVGLVLDRIR